MDLGQIAKAVEVAVKHNSPAILTGVAVVGTISTAVLSVRAAYRVGKDENAQHYESLMLRGETVNLSTKELVQTYWKEFIPPVVVGTATIACTIGANHVSSTRAAALASAYSISEKAFTEYRAKVAEQYSVAKEQKIRDAIAQDRVTENPPKISEIHITEATEQPCYESMTGRYFKTTVEKLNKARNDFNKQLLDEGYASMNDFWDLLGLEGTTVGTELGWTSDSLLEIHITTTLSPDGKPCLSLGYINAPKADFYRFR